MQCFEIQSFELTVIFRHVRLALLSGSDLLRCPISNNLHLSFLFENIVI